MDNNYIRMFCCLSYQKYANETTFIFYLIAVLLAIIIIISNKDSGKKNPYSVDGSVNSWSLLTKLEIAGRYSSVVKYFLSLYKALGLIPSKRCVVIHKLKVQLSYEEEICQCTTEMLEMHTQLWPYSWEPVSRTIPG